jgi:hypothetical protein
MNFFPGTSSCNPVRQNDAYIRGSPALPLVAMWEQGAAIYLSMAHIPIIPHFVALELYAASPAVKPARVSELFGDQPEPPEIIGDKTWNKLKMESEDSSQLRAMRSIIETAVTNNASNLGLGVERRPESGLGKVVASNLRND